MSDTRSMNDRGFHEITMTDHEFAEFVKRHDLTYRQHLIGTVWMDHQQNSFAVVIYNNANCTRKIFLKEGLIA